MFQVSSFHVTVRVVSAAAE